jgi:hypothetical protein
MVVDNQTSVIVVPPNDRLRLEYVGRGSECTNDPKHSITSCQFTFELFLDPTALPSVVIPSSPLPFLHPLPLTPWQGVAFWDNPVLQVFFTINDGGITPGPSDDPVLPLDPSAPVWTMPPLFFPPQLGGCGELTKAILSRSMAREALILRLSH